MKESNNIQLALKVSKSLKDKLDELMKHHDKAQAEIVRTAIEYLYNDMIVAIELPESVNLPTLESVNLPTLESVNLQDEVVYKLDRLTESKPKLALVSNNPTSFKGAKKPVKHTCDPANFLCKEGLCVGQSK